MSEWKAVSDELPYKNKQYLCCDVNGFREVGFFNDKKQWQFSGSFMGEIVAWMPLPEPYWREE